MAVTAEQIKEKKMEMAQKQVDYTRAAFILAQFELQEMLAQKALEDAAAQP